MKIDFKEKLLKVLGISLFLTPLSFALVDIPDDDRDELTSDILVKDSGLSQSSLYIEGDGQSESDPIVIYVPYATQVNNTDTSLLSDEHDYSVLGTGINSSAASGERLPVPTQDTARVLLNVYFEDTSTTTDRYYYLALQDNTGDYQIYTVLTEAGGLSTTVANTSSSSGPFAEGESNAQILSIRLSDICRDDIDCEFASTGGYETTDPVSAFLFVSDDAGESTSSTIDVSTRNGLFLLFSFSNVIDSDTRPSVGTLEKGDALLTWEDVNTQSIVGMDDEDLYKTFVVRVLESAGDPASSLTFRLFAEDSAFVDTFPYISEDFPNFFLRQYDPVGAGQLLISPLLNTISGTSTSINYCLSIFQVNKYQLSSLRSEVQCETPQGLAQFLQEQSCYLISAGFQKEHPTLRYFRFLRDHWLKESSLGRDFIKWYYESAPRYAWSIVKSETLSRVVRLGAKKLRKVFELLGLPGEMPRMRESSYFFEKKRQRP